MAFLKKQARKQKNPLLLKHLHIEANRKELDRRLKYQNINKKKSKFKEILKLM